MSGFMEGFHRFWPEYLAAHRDPRTRAIHYGGLAVALVLAIFFLSTWNWWMLVAAVAVGYGPAMASHPLIEGNIPKTFEHPVWSFMSDFYMFYLFLTGRLAPEAVWHQRVAEVLGDSERLRPFAAVFTSSGAARRTERPSHLHFHVARILQGNVGIPETGGMYRIAIEDVIAWTVGDVSYTDA